MKKVETMNNKEILDYSLSGYKSMVEYGHEEGMEPPTPIVSYYRNDYDGPLFTIMLRPFSVETKEITFATAMLINTVLPIDKVSITMDAVVSKVTEEEMENRSRPRPSEDPTSVDVVWAQIIDSAGNLESAGMEYKIADTTGKLVWDKKSRKKYSNLQTVQEGGRLPQLVAGSFNADSAVINQLTDVETDKERSEEYFAPLMQFLSEMDFMVMCSQYGIEFLESIGITDTQFIEAEDYLKEMEEE